VGATIDQLSNGRLILGVGIGAPRSRQTDGVQNLGPHADISARETALFDLRGRRGELMDEALEALHRLWTHDTASFLGEQIRFESVDLVPRPVQQPRPPIWVGGRVEAAITRAATLADGWFPSQASIAVLAEGGARVRRLAAEAGRPPPTLGVNLFAALDRKGDQARGIVRDGLGHRFRTEDGLFGATLAGTPDEVAERMLGYVAVGCSVFDLKFLPHRGPDSVRQMELLAQDVLPAVRAAAVARD
jgi:alkanesulfonate monooxygenase SsuD/methylene tetrahydromethanopterin reductase-like flavin-dependent oxidoreductase (luciferase family)